MKKIIVLLCVLATVNVFAQSTKGSKVPAVSVKKMDGSAFNTSKFSNNGKPMIIDFWATWCKPCVAELEAIADEYAKWAKETGVKVIIVSVDDARTMDKVAPFIKEQGWTYESYLDPNQDFQHAMQVINPPYVVIVDGNGQVVWTHNGYMEGEEDNLYAALKKVAKK